MGKKMSAQNSMTTILLTVQLIIGALNGWLIMLAFGLLHSETGIPTIGYFPTAFWLGIIFLYLVRWSIPFETPRQ